jgi:uncharacterized membrane protein
MSKPPSISPNAVDILALEIRHLAEGQVTSGERLARIETRLVKLLIHLGLDAHGTPQCKPLAQTEA